MQRTVLIVDDHARFRTLAGVLVRAAGFCVAGEAGTGADAVDAVVRLDPDFVLLDVQLPDFDGFEVMRRLSRSGSRTAFVLVSTREQADYGGKVETSEAVAFVSKAELSSRVLAQVLVGP